MLTVALGCFVVAANAFVVLLLAAMWTARASRRSQRSRDFPEVAGVRLNLHKANLPVGHHEEQSGVISLLRGLVNVDAGLLQEHAGAKGAAWTRARSVLATQHSRTMRQHRVSWDSQVKDGGTAQVCEPASATCPAPQHGWS